jgi:hypothetical protein
MFIVTARVPAPRLQEPRVALLRNVLRPKVEKRSKRA